MSGISADRLRRGNGSTLFFFFSRNPLSGTPEFVRKFAFLVVFFCAKKKTSGNQIFWQNIQIRTAVLAATRHEMPVDGTSGLLHKGGAGAEGGIKTGGALRSTRDVKCRRQGCPCVRKKGGFVTPTETNVHGDALRFIVKAWARHKTAERVLSNGWRLVAVGGLAAGGWWWLVVWRLAVGGGWRWAVGGPWGLSLRAVLKKTKSSDGQPWPVFGGGGGPVTRGGGVLCRALSTHALCLRWSRASGKGEAMGHFCGRGRGAGPRAVIPTTVRP